MISHKHKCIFVHIPKAAGTSVETFFLNDLGLDFEDKLPLLLGRSTNMYMPPRVISHLTAEQMVTQHYISEELFREYFKFSVVRHPLDRLFSTYAYLSYSAVLSFDVFVQEVFPELLRSAKWGFFLQPQSTFIMNDKKKLVVDQVCRLENLEDDFKSVQESLGMPIASLPHANSGGKHASVLRGLKRIVENPRLLLKATFAHTRSKDLSKVSWKAILDAYGDDFENFGYSSE